MSNNHYEAFTQAIIDKAAHDKRSQPWKCTVKPEPAHSDAREEWYEVGDAQSSGTGGGRIDVRENAFPMGDVDVRTNAFPMGEPSVRTNAFPI